MKALTLWQPWASLIAEGVKTVETRSWRAPKSLIGERIAIHAAARRPARKWFGWDGPPTGDPRDLCSMVRHYRITEAADGDGDYLYEWVGPLGAVVATAILADCVPMTAALIGYSVDGPHVCIWNSGALHHASHAGPDSFDIDISDQIPYGDFAPGRWAWLLDDVTKVDPPIPARGARRLWDWTAP